MRRSRRVFLRDTGQLTIGLAFLPSRSLARTQAKPDSASPAHTGKTYFIDTAGDDGNSGLSALQPWRSFAPVNARTFAPGDAILLKRGCVWHEELKLHGAGAPGQFLVLSAYGSGDRPRIQRDRRPSDRCIRLNNASFLKVSSVEVCDGGAGIVLFYDHSYNNRSVYLDDLLAHDFLGLPHASQSDRVSWSYGIGVTGVEDTPNNQTRVLSDLRITNTEVFNTGAGIALDWGNHFCLDGTHALRNKFGDVFMEHLHLHDNTVDGISFVSLFLTSVTGCLIQNSLIRKGARFAATGTAAVQVMYSKDVVLRNLTIRETPFNPCPDNAGLDFECDNENMLVEGCTFQNNAGPAIEVLATPDNFNPYTRNLVIRNNTFLGNNSARKIGRSQISVPDWTHGNMPTGAIYNNRYRNAPNTSFFGGDGNTTRLDVNNNTNVGAPDLELMPIQIWDFDANESGLQGWQALACISGLRVTGHALEGRVRGVDPSIISDQLALHITPQTLIHLVLHNATAAAYGQIYFITDADPAWNEAKHRDFWLYPDAAGFHTYTLDMSSLSGWSGVLKQLRVDPEQDAPSGTFHIRQIRLLERQAPRPA